ncbi:MAG: phytanoyl-CoA dioxygenase family protein [Bacteroidota bacterium]
MQVDKKKFEEDGFIVVKNVFSPEEVEQLRATALQTLEIDKNENRVTHIDEGHKSVYYTIGDLLGKPIGKLVYDKRLLYLATELLGEKPVYFGDSTYQIGTGDRGFHRDNIDRTFSEGPDWEGDYSIIRMGVYLQDHDIYSGGLKVQQGSHKAVKGKRILINSKAGDVVIWNLRTLHSGNSVRMQFLPNLPLGCRIENILPQFLIKSQQTDRISVFMSFAKPSAHLERFIEKYMKTKMKEHLRVSSVPDNIETNNKLEIRKIPV